MWDVPETCFEGMKDLGVTPPVALTFERHGILN
jgi:hypothetical protein